MGHDAADYVAVLETTPHRAIAPTLFGFERAPERQRVPIAIDAHSSPICSDLVLEREPWMSG